MLLGIVVYTILQNLAQLEYFRGFYEGGGGCHPLPPPRPQATERSRDPRLARVNKCAPQMKQF